MNVIYSFLTAVLFSLSLSGDLPYTTIQRGMETNDAHAIVSLGKDKIVLQVPGSDGAYPLSQAEMILTSFFQKNPKGTFVFRYKNTKSGEGNGTVIGSYVSKGNSYRSTFQFRSGKYETKLESLSIVKE
ncbi:MAG: DUF4783 domain-containing protein [Flavobacteriia bacterium]|jgi:hypothetical protein|nr:MAG: DUF4783 domain-containing protein [Flavobacteriia bacterium]